MNVGVLRIVWEVVIECDLFNLYGIFYEFLVENVDGFVKVWLVVFYNFRIYDYVSYWGLLVMIGIDLVVGEGNEYVIVLDDE